MVGIKVGIAECWPEIQRLALTYSRVSHLPSLISFWSYGRVVSLDKIEMLHIHFDKVYKHQTWHSGHSGEGLPSTKSYDPWSRGRMVSRD